MTSVEGRTLDELRTTTYSEVPEGLPHWQSKYSAGVNGSPAIPKQIRLNLLRLKFVFYLAEISVRMGGVSWRVPENTNEKQKQNELSSFVQEDLDVNQREQGPKHQQVDWTLTFLPSLSFQLYPES